MDYPRFVICYNFLKPKQLKQYIDDRVNNREFSVPDDIKRLYMHIGENTILSALTAIEGDIAHRRKRKRKRPWLIEIFENTESDRYQVCLESTPINTESAGDSALIWWSHKKYEDEKTDRFIIKQGENENEYYFDIDDS